MAHVKIHNQNQNQNQNVTGKKINIKRRISHVEIQNQH